MRRGILLIALTLRKTRLRFATPDYRYVAFGDDKDIAGIDNFVKIPSKSGSRQQ
jgi:hypothetical protein